MTRWHRMLAFGLCILAAGACLLPPLVRAQAPATTPGTAPATTRAAAGRATAAILADLNATQAEAQKVMPSLASLGDEAFRKGDGQKVIPHLKKMAALLNELAGSMDDPGTRKEIMSDRTRFLGYLAALGDAESQKALDTAAAGKGDDALTARSALFLVKWVSNSKDAAAQGKVLDDYAAVAKTNPENEDVAATLLFMSNVGAADAATSKKAIEVVRANLKGDAAKQILAEADAVQARQDLLGKPLTLEGRTSTGGKFTSADYKGKVVLVDFWATWCGPCIAGLPEVKQVYKDYHPKGLEIVGVSCDTGDDKVNGFIKDNDMTWMQLREETQNEADRWHPLAKKYGVDGIPTMFLIDKKGVLRFVDAREHLEDEVKKLLAEENAPAGK